MNDSEKSILREIKLTRKKTNKRNLKELKPNLSALINVKNTLYTIFNTAIHE